MMWLLDWRFLTSEQLHIILQYLQILNTVESGMMNSTQTLKCYMKHVTQVWPACLSTINKLEHSKERIKHIMEKEIPAVVPNFELKQPEPTTTTYPEIESESYVGIRYRKKRFITDLISLGIQGFTAFNTNRRVNQLKKGMKKLFEQQHHLENKSSQIGR